MHAPLLALTLIGCARAQTVELDGGSLHVTANTGTYGGSVSWTNGSTSSFAFAPLSFLMNGSKLTSSPGGGLSLTSIKSGAGTDPALGAFTYLSYAWNGTGTAATLCLLTTIRAFAALDALVFDTEFVSGIASVGGRTSGSPGQLSTWPSLQPYNSSTFGVVLFAGGMGGDGVQTGTWPGKNKAYGAYGASPLVLLALERTELMTFSALTHITAGFPELSAGGILTCGVQDSAVSVPPGFTISFIAVGARASAAESAVGVSRVADALFKWGASLLAFTGKQRTRPDVHAMISGLGFSTCAHAFYCPSDEGAPTGPGGALRNSSDGNYEASLLAVDADAVARALPLHFHLIDSFWYGERVYGGTWMWEDTPFLLRDRFPDGLMGMRARMAMPTLKGFAAHMGAWVGATPYALNASWEWYIAPGGTHAVPLSADFWATLLGNARAGWGLISLKNDHEGEEVSYNRGFMLGNVSGTEMWLAAQDIGALRAGVAVELCMEESSTVVSSVVLRAVTHARAGEDYVPNQANFQWYLGKTSQLFHAVGIWPSKDTYYSNASEVDTTVPVRGDCPFAGFREPYPLTHHVAAVFSAGPVQPSDMAGSADVDLIMTAARSDGVLLKPDRPAMDVPTQWADAVWGGSGGPQGKALTTYTVVGSYVWHYAFFVALTAPYTVTERDLFTPDDYTATITPWAWIGGGTAAEVPQRGPTVARPPALPLAPSPPQASGLPPAIALPFLWSSTARGWQAQSAMSFGNGTDSITVPTGSNYGALSVWMIAPVVRMSSGLGLAWYGEPGKLVAVSGQRTASFALAGDYSAVTISFIGAVSGTEKITFAYAMITPTQHGIGAASSAPFQNVTCVFPLQTRVIVFANGAANCLA